MRGEAVCPLLLCAGPDQPQQPWGEDKVFVAHRRPRAAPASPAPASGTPTEHVLASTGCHPGLRGAVHYYSFFFFYCSRECKISVGLFVFAQFSDLEPL